MPFFDYGQNNSGGSFDFSEDFGITHHVVIEAPTAEAADIQLVLIGGYFDGCDNGQDCSCCGDRWSRAWADEGTPEPTIYGAPALEYDGAWMPKGKEVVIHYADGRKVWGGKGRSE